MLDLRLRLHDTLTGEQVRLEPREPGHVRIYTCGPTVYDVAHVGHARAALAPDILVRHLRRRGAKVTYVRNVTDVDDKILKRAAENGEEPTALSARMAVLYQDDVRALGCVDPEHQPKVSETIAEIIALVQSLIAKGAAYEVDLGPAAGGRDVYYAVRSFPDYGKLSKRQLEGLRVGARIEVSGDKRDPLDFALWKGCSAEEWGWESPWGKGRPGWHIECSAMSQRWLGHGFDVHTGGMDLIFPHHENEIAQSEAAHPGEGPYAGVWIHNGFVNVDKEKMAKSLGNFVTLRDVYARNDPEALRYFLLTVHYRGPIAFDTVKREDGRVEFPGVIEAERRVDYLYGALARLEGFRAPPEGTAAAPRRPKELDPFAKLAEEAPARLAEALDDDLNTPVALAIVGELAKAANELVDLGVKRRKDASLQVHLGPVVEALHAALGDLVETLGLLGTPRAEYEARTRARRLSIRGLSVEGVEAKLQARAAAREAKDFAQADALRLELDALGIEVADGLEGSSWRVLP